MSHPRRFTVRLAASVAAAIAAAVVTMPSAASAASAFAQPVATTSSEWVAALDAPASVAATPVELAAVAWRPSGTSFESVRYRPRRGYRDRDRYDDRPSLNSSTQLHLGFYDPSEGIGTGFYGGFRGGPWVDPHVQLGLGVDWFHKSEDVTESGGGDIDGPGGVVIVPERTVSEYSVNMFPIYGFLKIAGDPSMSVIPYAGIGGGYNVLFLTASDFETGEEFDGTFGGWGWQLFGGAQVPLSGRSRIGGEVFYASTEVGRDVEDITGEYRETIDVDGLGFRFGLSWGF
jgi:hypothetical protein